MSKVKIDSVEYDELRNNVQYASDCFGGIFNGRKTSAVDHSALLCGRRMRFAVAQSIS